MSVINVLDKSLAELIAAGEVVERPASVVKELCENSIDAGATSVTVEIKNGGITYIRITDNGCGIEREDVPVAFVSHATSKLKTQEDLDSIFTLGFRGEALASIAGVSRVELLTRHRDEQVGTRYTIEGGRETGLDDAGCPCGTTVVVRDLFYNTPARMKFLKKDVSEANAVAGVIDRLSLSHPEISFRFIRDGKQTLVTSGNGGITSCAYSVLGREVSQTLIPVEYTLDAVTVKGLCSKPTGSRATRSMQFFFLNGRSIRSKTAVAALEEAYKGTVMTGRFPACVLDIRVDARTVDVNVHPAKTEVRFSDERKIFSAVFYAVKSAVTASDTRLQTNADRLTKTRPVPAQPETQQMRLGTQKRDLTQEPPKGMEFQVHSPVVRFPFEGNTAKTENRQSFVTAFGREETVREAQKTAEKEERQVQTKASAAEEPCIQTQEEAAPAVRSAEQTAGKQHTPQTALQPGAGTDAPMWERTVKKSSEKPVSLDITVEDEELIRYVGEAFKTYIIVQQGEKLIFIDKHAAHERMIYERIKNQTESCTQVLLSPVAVTLSKGEYTAVTEGLQLLQQAGYDAEDFGTGTVLIRGCPMYLEYGEIAQTVQEIAGYMVKMKNTLMTEKLEWILHNTACRAAVKAGDHSSAAENERFARSVLENNSIRYCPHGRPVLFEMSRRDMEKMFGRIR